MADFDLAAAHDWLDGLKAADASVVMQMLDGLRELVDARRYGSVTATVVAGKLKQVELKQTLQAGS